MNLDIHSRKSIILLLEKTKSFENQAVCMFFSLNPDCALTRTRTNICPLVVTWWTDLVPNECFVCVFHRSYHQAPEGSCSCRSAGFDTHWAAGIF